MKKYIVIALAAVVAFTACTKTNPEEKKSSDMISFQVANYVPQTKANVSIYPEVGDAGFNTMAWLRAADTPNNWQSFFGANGENIKWNNSEWAPATSYYWPKAAGSVINFFSWYDNSKKPVVVNNATTTSMTWTDRKIGLDDNIMYAEPAWHFNKNTNPAMYGSQLGNAVGAASQGVPTLFHHALSQIALKAYLVKPEDDETTTWEVKVSDYYFSKYYTTGTLALTATEPALTVTNTAQDWDATSAEWSIAATAAKDGSYGADAAKAVTAEAQANADVLLTAKSVLPQVFQVFEEGATEPTVKNAEAQLAFSLYIKTTYGNGASNEETIPVVVPLTSFNVNAWAMNTKYTYIVKIVLGENKILFDPAVVDYFGPVETVTTVETK